jgi:hypothetical protein
MGLARASAECLKLDPVRQAKRLFNLQPLVDPFAASETSLSLPAFTSYTKPRTTTDLGIHGCERTCCICSHTLCSRSLKGIKPRGRDCGKSLLAPTNPFSRFRDSLHNVSRTVKDFGQLIRVFAFAVEGAADRSEGLGERKNVASNKQIGIFRPHRMPVHTLSGNRDFRH